MLNYQTKQEISQRVIELFLNKCPDGNSPLQNRNFLTEITDDDD